MRLTVDDPVVLLPPCDKMAPAQDKVLRAHDSARKRALGPMLTAERMRCKPDPLRKILRCLDELAAFERDGGELPKLHAAVKEAHEVSDTARRAALLNALRVETEDAIQRCATKGAAEREKRTRDVAAQNGAARLQLHREDSVYCGSITRRTRTNAPPLIHPPSCTVDPGRT